MTDTPDTEFDHYFADESGRTAEEQMASAEFRLTLAEQGLEEANRQLVRAKLFKQLAGKAWAKAKARLNNEAAAAARKQARQEAREERARLRAEGVSLVEYYARLNS
jgi:hypothetical protein